MTGAGVDPTGLVKTEEEIQLQMQQEAQAQQMAEMKDLIGKLGPHAIKMMGDNPDLKGQLNGTAGVQGPDQGGAGGSANPSPPTAG
jgi:hypothetical protein